MTAAWSRASRWLGVLAIVVSTVGCDRVTKTVAVRHLAGRPRLSLLADSVRLEYAENAGGFLSLGASLPVAIRRGVFTVGTAILLFAAAVVMLRRLRDGEPAAAIALFWAGGVANLVDRACQGRVVDFLNLGVGPIRTGIFNVADVAITIGAIVLLAQTARDNRRTDEPRCRPTPR